MMVEAPYNLYYMGLTHKWSYLHDDDDDDDRIL